MAVKVIVWCRTVGFDGVTITLPVSLRLTGQDDDVGHDFTGLAANIANAAAMEPYVKTQVVDFILAHYGVTVTAAESPYKAPRDNNAQGGTVMAPGVSEFCLLLAWRLPVFGGVLALITLCARLAARANTGRASQ